MVRKKALAQAVHNRNLRKERKLQSNLGAPNELGGLIHFVRYFWDVLEPGKTLVEGWALYAICMHLEAVTRGEIRRLLINVPPGFMKSMLVNVYWPAWEWSVGLGVTRYVTFSYVAYLTQRDNGRFSDVLGSREYKELWGHEIRLEADAKVKVENQRMGWKFASSVEGVGTGERGDRILADDLHNVKEGESEKVRAETVRWVREGMANRLNDMVNGVIIGIGQRVHEDDASSAMIADGDYVHLMIPMEYDPSRPCSTVLGWSDPRSKEGELAWEERFPAQVVAKLKRTLGPYAYSAQYQQSPKPRGGNIFKDEWWEPYELPLGKSFSHGFDYRIASLDPAYTAKQENDPSGFTVWGVYTDKKTGRVKILLLGGWNKWLEIHGREVERLPNEEEAAYIRRSKPEWGLVEWVAYECKRHNVNTLLIENKASGLSVSQEIRRLYADKNWGVVLIDPKGLDKRSRAYAVQHLFADEMIQAPAEVKDGNVYFREWAQTVITEASKFRGLPGEEDNLVDSMTQSLEFLRKRHFAIRADEAKADSEARARHRPQSTPIYEV